MAYLGPAVSRIFINFEVAIIGERWVVMVSQG